MHKLLLLMFITSLLSGSSKEKTIELASDSIRLILPLGAWGTTLYLDDTKGQFQFYKSFTANALATYALKYSVQEERPNKSDKLSFPSGHSSVSFQSASFIHIRYGLKYALIPYLGASFCAWSRVYLDEHYTHDVLAGAALGSLFSYYFTTPYKYKNISISPNISYSTHTKHNIYGVSLQW